MYARLKNLVATSALVGAALTGSVFAMSQYTANASTANRTASAPAHVAGPCKPGQGDACKPGGCCIVN